jgi:hypothetical protein
VTAIFAFTAGIVFEEFNAMLALGAIYLEYVAGLPKFRVLPWAFHFFSPLRIGEKTPDRDPCPIFYLDSNRLALKAP